MADWKSLPAGSKARYDAAKKDPAVSVGGFDGGDYMIRTKKTGLSSRPTEDQQAQSARKFFGNGKTMGLSNRPTEDEQAKGARKFFDNERAAKKAALTRMMQSKKLRK